MPPPRLALYSLNRLIVTTHSQIHSSPVMSVSVFETFLVRSVAKSGGSLASVPTTSSGVLGPSPFRFPPAANSRTQISPRAPSYPLYRGQAGVKVPNLSPGYAVIFALPTPRLASLRAPLAPHFAPRGLGLPFFVYGHPREPGQFSNGFYSDPMGYYTYPNPSIQGPSRSQDSRIGATPIWPVVYPDQYQDQWEDQGYSALQSSQDLVYPQLNITTGHQPMEVDPELLSQSFDYGADQGSLAPLVGGEASVIFRLAENSFRRVVRNTFEVLPLVLRCQSSS